MDLKEYGEDVQRLLIGYMLSDSAAFTMSQNIIQPEYFDDRLRPAVKYILGFSEKYRSLPTVEQVAATTNVVLTNASVVSEQHSQWYLDTIEQFCRYRALENIILDGVDLLRAGQGSEVERRIKDAMTISITTDLGTDYFDDPQGRLETLRDKSNFVSTGWQALDDKLYGGFTKGALNVFAGGSGSGKSLFLQNIALNWATQGKTVVYFTLELAETLVSIRMDAMVTNTSTKQVMGNINQASIQIKTTAAKYGKIFIKKLPEAGTNANDLRAYLKQFEIEMGFRPDAIVVDYLDLLHPNSNKINPSDLFVKDKYVSEELRALVGEYDVLCATASQLNRNSVEAQEFDHSHIAGGISKINTADNVFGIYTTTAMRETGKYELQFLKTRSAAAVGQKIRLAYDVNSMRITDDPDTMLNSFSGKSTTPTSSLQKSNTTTTNAVASPQINSPRDSIMALINRSNNK